ncbi:protein-L-isoaspartate O-methyltransferase [Ferrimonas balearica DSM 9799]|uniref:Protein-L-isoaspartate O-methyltransferase n=1 Tax=Ferrimonas balearica (strain DSM 9799 / CCM 4581 / KCTC 23876 / PAT) TaxID=550540 RepID=E1ST04_FERBD|nr:protein-L-isoaspartate(D-aspartate) O-methyltransferase [Ferrimonas balearica]ADN75060.1 protein-L-isoaspartate O-methyltransferase [Ferrimonas balearica DSM 9799]MBW3164479.1 protein-L-isoaspartate(D-aspartate) O-methyltransferase [Ferrimonas balearica]
MTTATSAYGSRLAHLMREGGISNPHVLDAMAAVPRQLFVDGGLAPRAWENTALPIGQGQTISQPYIVARMTELLLERLGPGPVLEIGTGSGYQAAILASLVPQLCTVERIKSLQIQARRRLKQLDLHNIAFKYGDGWQGWPSKAPFGGILVTAAASEVPQALLAQLAEGGRLVIPVGSEYQVLRVIDKIDGQLHSRDVEAVRFVPLVPGETE